MPRTLPTLATTLAITAVTALPAWAADDPEQIVPASKGTFGGVLLALIIGVLFGAVFTFLAYRRVEFGEDPAHHEQAHDIRRGAGSHETPEPGVEDMPTGGLS